MKNPLTPAGIEPATFRFVAQRLNHYATAVPRRYLLQIRNSYGSKGNKTDIGNIVKGKKGLG